MEKARSKENVISPEKKEQKNVLSGKYELRAQFLDRDGKSQNISVTDVYTHEGMTPEDLLEKAESWISMIGLHNYGLKTSRDVPGDVKFTLEHKVEASSTFEGECLVNSAGHIVKK
jgi:hypothetical protein